METVRALILPRLPSWICHMIRGQTATSNPRRSKGKFGSVGKGQCLSTSHLWPPWSRIWAEEDSGSKGLPGWRGYPTPRPTR